MNTRVECAKAFLGASSELLKIGDASGAASLVANTWSGMGPVWTWEVEAVHKSPSNDEEKKISSELDKVLLKIAEKEFEYASSTASYVCTTPYIWYIVLCLNKLGDRAPKELINKTIDKINDLGAVDGRRITVLLMLKSFLPVVSYFH